MPLAELMLKQISDAGFSVTISVAQPPEPEGFQISAMETTTGVVTRVSDPSLATAATRLADELGVYCKLTNDPVFLGYRAPLPPENQKVIPLPALLGVTAIIFLLDVFTPGLNLGVLYVIPLILARRSHFTNRELGLYTVILMCLTFADHVVNEMGFRPVPPEPAELFNRTLAMGMIAATTAFILLYRNRQPRAPYRADPPRANSPLTSVPGPAMKDQMADRLTALLIGFIFMADLVSPQPIDVAILYLSPLALAAIAHEHRGLWKLVAVLIGLTLVGYLASPGPNAAFATPMPLVMANRVVVCCALLLAALVLHIRSRAMGTRGLLH